jgi:hypothetical protein
MTAWFDRLGLQPGERRMVLGALVVFVALMSYWFLWPKVDEYSKIERSLEETARLRGRYLSETTKTNSYAKRLRELQTSGAQLAGEDAANRLQADINREASNTGVQINSMIPSTVSARIAGGQTNQFFDDIQVTVSLSAGEQELVDFLYGLGSGASMVRVRDVSNLRLDPTQTRLTATLTFVASVQKKTAPAGTGPARKPNPPAPVPAGGSNTVPKASSANPSRTSTTNRVSK